MAKAYDDDPEGENDVIIPRHGQDLIVEPDPHSYQAVFAPLRSVGLGEVLTVLTLLYVGTIAAFNAAYFASIPGSFVEFFSLTDLIQTNLPIIQYFVSLFITYTVIGTAVNFVSAMTEVDFRQKARDLIEPIMIKYHLEGQRFWIALVIAIAAYWIFDGIFQITGVTYFTALMLPTFIFQGALLYFFWVGYKYKLLPARQLALGAFVGLFVCSNNAGYAWLKSQIADPSHIQAIQDKDGNCLDRNILRNSGSGILLYNPSMTQYEFRNKDSIKTIFQKQGCV
ncbi:hypothetical protein SSBR45G_55310 [Bradyrhizobium sp. SSBR45G]|uniref:hypothetical protein n=1 Tax=unclassified Bradyrhizobium TaxID=2631580 RepID=UPI002342B1DB|nr:MULTISPECIES: hypothetical protein [unclassified Bradyrhizobium]GLH80622.1 hypothetical protein SSBR45G_55310 [Bradyrhizobium sp. SSBR45G]GLH85828.1 hypothetical protein SSBR45R_32880 [Bradyrhizobium sp. SSBR45R]